MSYAGYPNKDTYDAYIHLRYNVSDAVWDTLITQVALESHQTFQTVVRASLPGWVDADEVDYDFIFDHLDHDLSVVARYEAARAS